MAKSKPKYPTPDIILSMKLLVVIMLFVIVLSGSGCQRTLFPQNKPRTQFDAHERMRNPYIQLEEPDEFGKPQPALRTRLTHRD